MLWLIIFCPFVLLYFIILQSTFLRPTHSLTRSPTHALTSPSAHSHSYARSATSTCTHSRTNTRKHTLIEHINLSPTHALAFPLTHSCTHICTHIQSHTHSLSHQATYQLSQRQIEHQNILIYERFSSGNLASGKAYSAFAKWNGYMFILSEETSTGQIFGQSLSLLHARFRILRCQKFWLPSLLTLQSEAHVYLSFTKICAICKTRIV